MENLSEINCEKKSIIFLLDLDYLVNQHFYHKMFRYFPVIEID